MLIQIGIFDKAQFQDSGAAGDTAEIQIKRPLNNGCTLIPFPSMLLLEGFCPFQGDHWTSNPNDSTLLKAAAQYTRESRKINELCQLPLCSV